mmetsp:Transcript_12603/g.36781  ORF Transcript_12603/g.36781 Transcript_12603/m.36781 type:complete len:86 (+) Transcript_12603:471-728(+)
MELAALPPEEAKQSVGKMPPQEPLSETDPPCERSCHVEEEGVWDIQGLRCKEFKAFANILCRLPGMRSKDPLDRPQSLYLQLRIG